MNGRVSWISLTPVMATALQLLDEVELLESGPKNDRRFYFVTEGGRLLNNKDCPPLQLVPSTYDEETDTLGALAAYRGDLETTEPLPFGVHAAVAATGRVRVGDTVTPE